MLKIDPFKFSIAIAIALGCLLIPLSLAQSSEGGGSTANKTGDLIESGIRPEAMPFYDRAVHEMREGHAVLAEADATRALHVDPKFADAAALAATAALMQEQFSRAATEASEAIQINANDEKAYVILATARNYLGDYTAAEDALRHVHPEEQQTWQVAYQWARAEAGLQHLPQCVEWLNRAALSAPVNFAPLHLLRASALLAMGDNARAADELDIYLKFPSVNAKQRELLTEELQRLRRLPTASPLTSTATGN